MFGKRTYHYSLGVLLAVTTAAARSQSTDQASSVATPFQSVMLPYVQQQIAAHAQAKGGQASPALTPMSNATYVPSPNFGGFQSGPAYLARTTLSVLNDTSNAGVCSELTADFNQDGHPDIAVLQYDGTLNLLLNSGTGTLLSDVAYTNPNFKTTQLKLAFAADINNDGYPDIIAFDSLNQAVIVWLNLKNGTFGAPITTAITRNYGSVASIAVQDLNGDGYPDVLVASIVASSTSSTLTLQTLFGMGNGNFNAATSIYINTVTISADLQMPYLHGISLADINGDGKPDVIATLEEGYTSTTGSLIVSTALGTGTGTFGNLGVNALINVPVTSVFHLSFGTSGAQVVDINHDGIPDLVVDAGGGVYSALGTGSGNFGAQVSTANFPTATEIVYKDVNGDGYPDLIEEGGLLQVWLGKGDGTFLRPGASQWIIDGGGLEGIVLADFNGDGNPDIAQLGGTYKEVSIYFGNGKGNFRAVPTLLPTTDAVASPNESVLEDVVSATANGFSDVLLIDESQATPYLVTGLSDGKGNFTYVSSFASGITPNFSFLEPVQADFNGDGLQDLLIAGTGGALFVALSKGDGTFKAPVAINMPSTLACRLTYGSVADVNHDGKPDIVVAYPGDAQCSSSTTNPSGYFVIAGNGDGTFQTPVFTAYGKQLYQVVIKDMNLDGNPDLILDDAPTIAGTGFAVYQALGNGNGTFATPTTVLSGYVVTDIVAGNYNADGNPDLVLFAEELQGSNVSTGGILLVPGRGDGSYGDYSLLAEDNWFLQGQLLDVNGDGLPDIEATLYQTTGQPNTYYGFVTLLNIGQGQFAPPVNELEILDSDMPLSGNFFNDNAPDFITSTTYGTALWLGQGGTTLTLTDSAASLSFGQAETITATVAASMSGRATPTGSVSFYNGTTLLGVGSLNSSGVATYASASLPVGANSITAVYSGDGNFNVNALAATTVTVTALTAGFTLALSPSSATVSHGQTAVTTLTLTANATFSGAVTLACSGVPSNATCTINPGTLTLVANGVGTASVVIATTLGQAVNHSPIGSSPLGRWRGSAGFISVAALFCLFRRRRKRWVSGALALGLLVMAGLSMTACSSSGSSAPSFPTAAGGTYTISVIATPPSGSAATTQTVTFTLTVN